MLDSNVSVAACAFIPSATLTPIRHSRKSARTEGSAIRPYLSVHRPTVESFEYGVGTRQANRRGFGSHCPDTFEQIIQLEIDLCDRQRETSAERLTRRGSSPPSARFSEEAKVG